MRDWQTLARVRWECKYHIVWVPTPRRKVLHGKVWRTVAEVVRGLCSQLGLELIEGHAMVDHVHLHASFAPRYSVAKIGLPHASGPYKAIKADELIGELHFAFEAISHGAGKGKRQEDQE